MGNRFDFQKVLFGLISFIFGILIFIFVLTARIPGILRQTAIQAKYAFTIPFAALILLLIYTYFNKFRLNKLNIWPILCALFALPLAGMWASGITEAQVIGGLLPTADAGLYYTDALRLIDGGQFSFFSSRRPIFAAFLSSILQFCGKNLQVTLAVIVFFVLVAIYISSETIRQSIGKPAVIMFVILNFFFIRKYTGRVMTENLGFIFGLLSITFFVIGVKRNVQLIWGIGIFSLTVAMNTRAGPFIVLPLLVVWAWFSEKDLKKRIIASSIALIAIFLGFLFNALVFQLFGNPNGIPFANFLESLYGMVRGGVGWGAIYTEHPNLIGLDDQLLVKAGIPLIVDAFKANPILFFNAILNEYRNYFNPSSLNSMFSFVYSDNRSIFTLMQILFQILYYLGIFSVWNRKLVPTFRVFLYIALGILLSIPFAPVTDAEGMRAFAAIIPFTAAIAGIGLNFVTEKVCKNKEVEVKSTQHSLIAGILSITSLIFLISFIPFMLKAKGNPQLIVNVPCPSNEVALQTTIYPGSSIIIYPDEEFFLDWIPYLHYPRFKQGLRIFPPHFVEFFTSFTPPYQISLIKYSPENKDTYIVIDEPQFFNKPGKYQICGTFSENQIESRVGTIFIVRSMHLQTQLL